MKERDLRKYVELRGNLLDEAETVLAEIAAIGGMKLLDDEGHPTYTSITVDDEWSVGREAIITTTGRYIFGKYKLSELRNRVDLQIEASFPARYLWETADRKESLKRELFNMRVFMLLSGPKVRELLGDSIADAEAEVESFDNKEYAGRVRTAGGASYSVPPHQILDKLVLLRGDRVLISPMEFESVDGTPIARIYGIIDRRFSTPLATILNWQAPSCGTPPQLDNSDPKQYIGVFANGHGQQFAFVYDRTARSGFVRLGDAGWGTSYPVKDGVAQDLVMGAGERAWLSACWDAATRLKKH